MAELKYINKLNSNENIYDDGNIEEKLLNHYKYGNAIDENEAFYLTTDIRNNILNWYPFDNNKSVLEIGCGCGTLTEILCEKCKNVTCVEGSSRRAEITYYRHKNKKNLEIYSGNFEDLKLNKKFDYIVLIGVFEYAKRFFDNPDPFNFFLKKIKSMLKDNGIVLIAIENRYGLKYWNGCNEDHLNKQYIGLEGYEETDIQTFGKVEFINLIKNNGFTKYKFYYPFPDYKLPYLIYTDSRLPQFDEIQTLPFFTYGNKVNFNYNDVFKGLIDNNEFGFFSNSYLIEFGFDKSGISDVIYARNSINRKIDYKVTTFQLENKKFFKTSSNIKHLEEMLQIHEEIKKIGIKCSNIIKENQKFYIENIDGISEVNYFNELIKNKEIKKIYDEFDKIYNFYKSISNFKKMENPIIKSLNDVYEETYVLKLSLIDGNISNIIRKNNEYYFIDQEWLSNYEIPMEYLFADSLKYIYGINKNLGKIININEILDKYSISHEKVQILSEINDKFYKEEKNILNLKSCDIINNCKSNTNGNELDLQNVIYYDNGDGFNGENLIIGNYIYDKINDCYTFNVSLKKVPKLIRFDPVINGGKLLKIKDIKVNNKSVKYDEYNFYNFENCKLLIKDHPFVTFEVNSKNFKISLKILDLSEEEKSNLFSYFIKNEEEIKKLEEEKINLTNSNIKKSIMWKLFGGKNERK